MAADIVTFAASGFPGPHRTLENLARCTGMTRHFQLHSNDPDGVELEFYAHLIRGEKPKLVLFGGWCTLYEALIAKLRRSSARFAVWWLSTAGQSDMSGEVGQFGAAMRHPRLRFFGFAQEALAKAVGKHLVLAGKHTAYLPIPMDLSEFQQPVPRHSGPAALSFYCSPHEHRRKNVLNTLLAVANLQDDYLLHVNGLSRDPSYRHILRALQIHYRDLGWMPDEVYRASLDQIDIGLQLSFTESFNQVAAEHLARGIPVVASPLVPAMNAIRGADRSRLIVESFEDANAISERIAWLIRHPRARIEIGRRAGANLRTMIAKNNRMARRALQKWMEEL